MKTAMIALALSLVACAGGDFESQDGFTEDFATLEQGLTSQISSGSGGGRRITGVMQENAPFFGLTFNAINSLDDSLTWFVPPFKTITIKAAQGSCSTVQWNRLNPRITEIINEMNTALSANGWSITRNDSTGKHTLQCLALPASPLGADHIRNFVRTQCSTDFANPVDDQGLPGVATRYDVCTVGVDSAEILSYGTTTSNENRQYRHAIGHGLLQLVGVGEESGTNGTFSQGTSQQTVALSMFTSGQLCRTKFYTIGSPTVYGTTTAQGCANN